MRGVGVPDFGAGYRRNRLHALLDSCGDIPTVIAASSGSGKTFLAAQFAREWSDAAIWLDAGGAFLDTRELRDGLLAAAGCLAPDVLLSDTETPGECAASVASFIKQNNGRRVCLVVDDYGLPNTERDAVGLSAFAAALARAGLRVIITTRSTCVWASDALRQWVVIDEQHLTLDASEAAELGGLACDSVTAETLEDLRSQSGGHVAFFLAMLAQVRRYGSIAGPTGASAVEAWLARILADMCPSDVRALALAAALKTGTDLDLDRLGVSQALHALTRLRTALSLITVASTPSGGADFRVHDLVDGYFTQRSGLGSAELDSVIALLTARGDHVRACELLSRSQSETAAERWLLDHGDAALGSGSIAALSRVLRVIPISSLMSSPRLLVLSSRVCFQIGEYEESLSRANAARLLGDHEGDNASVRGAIAQSLWTLRMLARLDEAIAMAESVVDTKGGFVDDSLLAEALLCIGIGRLHRADHEADVPLQAALSLVAARPEWSALQQRVRNALALSTIVQHGDHHAAQHIVSGQLEKGAGSPAMNVILRGNLALCLTERGRVERALALLRPVVRETQTYSLDVLAGAYLPVMGMALLSSGEQRMGIDKLRDGIAASLRAGDHSEAAISRTYLALALRALGHTEESLTEAERALESLGSRDQMDFRHVASLEVATSLLAGGDAPAARSLVESIDSDSGRSCKLHTLRAALTLSECDRLEGDVESAVARLSAHEEYIRSENPNLLVAMYCRAFPSVMSTLARAMGTEALPAHMLRMIPPEGAEVILTEARTQLEEPVWKDLGLRLLGEEEFGRFLLRDGLPVLHVRFFGGLEASIGGRAIREKDWHKRKARLLFAMLILRRGQDVPRDQLFEYLFADMDPERAKNNLYVLWSTMKSVIMGEGIKGVPFPYFEALGGVCRSVRDNIRCDVDDFDRLLRHAREHEAAGELAAAITHYERLSALYRGDLLPGDVYDDWFAELRDSYRITFVNAMLTASEILMNADDPGNALVFARRAIQTDPLREDLYQVALRCQIAAGQRSGAIDTYLQCRTKLAEDLGLDPSAETKALYEQILAMEDRPRIIPLDPFSD